MKYFYVLLCFLMLGLETGFSQSTDSLLLGKLDVGMKLALRQAKYKADRMGKRSIPVVSDTLLPVILRCTDSETVVTVLQGWGIEARAIVPLVATARIPYSLLRQVAELPEVTMITASRKGYATMKESRMMTGMDRVQSGEGLESPYTGKGVVVGVIDQGFEYTHPAFSTADGNLRIKRVWNRYLDQDSLLTPEAILNAKSDGIEAAHATHVMNIAAGSKVDGTDFYGNAPDAELVVVPSTFEDNEVLEDVKFIYDYAASQRKPCVINMSFGSQTGPHDGTGDYDRAMDLLSGAGRVVVAAMGNDGTDPVHLMKRFVSGQDTLRALLRCSSTEFPIYVLGSDPNSFNIDFFLYDPDTHAMIFPENDFWESCLSVELAINDQNGKYTAILVFNSDEYNAQSGYSDNYLLGIRVFDTPKDYVVHMWTNYSQGTFVDLGRDDDYFVRGDANYTVGEGGASPSRTLAIGAYVNCTDWTALNGENISFMGFGLVNEIANYSTYGPQLDNNLPKPLICAPGSAVTSAYGKYEEDLNLQEDIFLEARVLDNGEDFYYGKKAGTSMASPQVAGIIACWMQAYPQLTPEQAMEIIRKTAINDAYTGNIRDTWHNQWGYGKIDAYEGLKECIKLAAASGINEVLDSETPVSIYKTGDCWKIFFNNDETQVSLTLFSLGGTPVMERKLPNVPCGYEEILSLNEYVPGCYLLRIQTAKALCTRKILIE